jgi:hypothetical protein
MICPKCSKEMGQFISKNNGNIETSYLCTCGIAITWNPRRYAFIKMNVRLREPREGDDI